MINIANSGHSRGCHSSKYPNQTWFHGDRRICILLRHKYIETLREHPQTTEPNPSGNLSIIGAGFRSRYEYNPGGRFSLGIGPLGELVDIYHSRKAIDRRDKVYALLGMSLDDPSKPGLSATYMSLWKTSFIGLLNSPSPTICPSGPGTMWRWRWLKLTATFLAKYP